MSSRWIMHNNFYFLLEFLRFPLVDEPQPNEGCSAVLHYIGVDSLCIPIKGYGIGMLAMGELIVRELRLHQISKPKLHLIIKIDGRPFWGNTFFYLFIVSDDLHESDYFYILLKVYYVVLIVLNLYLYVTCLRVYQSPSTLLKLHTLYWECFCPHERIWVLEHYNCYTLCD